MATEIPEHKPGYQAGWADLAKTRPSARAIIGQNMEAFDLAILDLLQLLRDFPTATPVYSKPHGLMIYYHKGLGFRVTGPTKLFGISKAHSEEHWWRRWQDWQTGRATQTATEHLGGLDINAITTLMTKYGQVLHRPNGTWLVSNRAGDPVSLQALAAAFPKRKKTAAEEAKPAGPVTFESPFSNIGSPFHLPKFTDDKFEELHNKYVAEHGTKVNIPDWNDIVHIQLKPEYSELEYNEYKQARKQGRTPVIDPRITSFLDAKATRYRAMLATPQPKWYRNTVAVMTAIDDAQDALSAACLIAKLAIKAAPKLLGRFLGPLGWVLLANDILNFATMLARLPFTARRAKRRAWDFFDLNPFLKRTRLSNAAKYLHRAGVMSSVIEAAQVSDNMFGLGVCLGPIMAVPADVAFKWVDDRAKLYSQAADSYATPTPYELRSNRIIYSAPAALATNPMITHEERLTIHTARLLALAHLSAYQEERDPWDAIPDMTKVQIHAPTPTNPLTRDILEEFDINPDEGSQWPILDRKTASMDEIARALTPAVTKADTAWIIAHKHEPLGFAANTIRHMAGRQCIANLFPEAQQQEAMEPQALHMTRLMNHAGFVDPANDPTKVDAWWQNATTRADHGRSPLNTRTLELLAQRAGVKITRYLPQLNDADVEKQIAGWIEASAQLAAIGR